MQGREEMEGHPVSPVLPERAPREGPRSTGAMRANMGALRLKGEKTQIERAFDRTGPMLAEVPR